MGLLLLLLRRLVTLLDGLEELNECKCFNYSIWFIMNKVRVEWTACCYFKTSSIWTGVILDSHCQSSDFTHSCICLMQKTTFFYLVANAKFMLDDEEHFEEQMQEKLRMYGERNKEQDFWIVLEPEFLDKQPEVAKRVGRPAVALVSTDKVWITWVFTCLVDCCKWCIMSHSTQVASLKSFQNCKLGFLSS